MYGKLSASIPEDLEKRMDIYLERHKKEYDGVSDLIQQLLIEFFEPNGSWYYIKIFMLYLGYPLIVAGVFLFAYIRTGDGWFMSGNNIMIGILLGSCYLLFTKYRGKK